MVAEVLKLMGRSVGFGHAVGPAFILKKQSVAVSESHISKEQIPQEWARFEMACKEAERQLLKCKTQMGDDGETDRGEIFDIQIALLKDSYILQELKLLLQSTLKNVESCWLAVVEKCVQKFREHESLSKHKHYWDLQDISKRLLMILSGADDRERRMIPKNSILIAESLEPSDIIALKDAKIAGLVLECDCETSHAIILAKSLHIPILIGVEGACSQIKEGAMVEIDSENGACWINKKVANTLTTQTLYIPDKISLGKEAVHFYLSYDGNISPFLKTSAVAGIGLVRTETLFFNREAFPHEEEQFLIYRDIVTAANGKPVVLRTLDVGGDKIPKGQFVQELNPFLGLRGIRYSLKNEEQFRQQLSAMLRASAFGCVKILYPMISDVSELVRANQALEECKESLRNKKIAFDVGVKVGAMIETPGAVFCMNELAKHCDFFSIGTNDLIQYTLAVDRTNSAVAHLYQMTHPAIFQCLRLIAQQARSLNKKLLVCGELPNATVPFLMCLSLGYRSFVAYDNNIPHLAHLCNRLNLDDLRMLALEAQSQATNDAVFSVFEKYYKKFLNEIKNS